jgi:futalosine hydrolase
VTLLLCTATARELEHLLAAIPKRPGKTKEPGTELHPLQLKHGPALACVTGVGPINAALVLGHALGRAAHEGKAVKAVLLAGLAGAFDLHARPLRSLCLVQEEIWPEYGLHDGQKVKVAAFPFPLWQTESGMQITNRLSLASTDALQAFGARCPQQPFLPSSSLTVAGVSGSNTRARELHSQFRADLENMEGFAVAYACTRYGIPCVEIRSVSNKVGQRATDEKDFPGAYAALEQILPALNLV